MFLTTSNTYYDSSGSQHASKAWYLILATLDTGDRDIEHYTCATCGEPHPSLYANARKVAMSQCGQFMMGIARIGGNSIVVSGQFGSDGLPKHMGTEPWHTLRAETLPYFTKLPDSVASSYWHSGADYHAGKSGDYTMLRAWALASLVYPLLVKAGLAPYAITREAGQWGHQGLYRKWRTDRERQRASYALRAVA